MTFTFIVAFVVLLITSPIWVSMLRPSRKRLIDETIRQMKENPEDWRFDMYTVNHNKSGMRIWTSNIPIINLHFYKPASLGLRINEAIRLHRAIQQLRNDQLRAEIKEDVSKVEE